MLEYNYSYFYDEEQDDDGVRLQESAALFLLGLKEKQKLTQVTAQAIIEGVTNLMQVRYNYCVGMHNACMLSHKDNINTQLQTNTSSAANNIAAESWPLRP